jgi:hypothetical protein
MSWKRHTCYFFVCMNPIGVEISIMMVSAMSDIESMCRSQQRRSCEITNWLTSAAAYLGWVTVARYFLYIDICMSSFYID